MTENRFLRGASSAWIQELGAEFYTAQQGVTAKGGIRYWNYEDYEAVSWK